MDRVHLLIVAICFQDSDKVARVDETQNKVAQRDMAWDTVASAVKSHQVGRQHEDYDEDDGDDGEAVEANELEWKGRDWERERATGGGGGMRMREQSRERLAASKAAAAAAAADRDKNRQTRARRAVESVRKYIHTHTAS